MRVLVLNRYQGFRSGVEKFVHDLGHALERHGHWAGLAYEEDRKDPADYGGAFRETLRLPLYGGDPEAQVGEILARTRPDLLFAHNVFNAAWIDRFRRRVPTIQMIHDHESFCLNGKKYFYLTTQQICDKPVGMLCYARCTGLRRTDDRFVPLKLASLKERRDRLETLNGLSQVIVCSSFMKRELVRNGVRAERIAVLSVFVEVPPEPPPYPAGSQLVLFVGRLNREKGIGHFLEALARVGCGWRAAVVGEGRLSAARHLAAELGIAERVTFHGFKPFDEVRRLYREAALVVMPSIWPEPLGMVGLEAMAHARPVVAYETGGIPDWLVDGVSGNLVSRGDLKELARGIEQLLADPMQAERMGAAGYEWIRRSRYTPEHFMGRFLELAEAVARLAYRRDRLTAAGVEGS